MSTRRITSGRVGRAVLGALVVEDNRLEAVVANANVILEPNGTGIVESTSEIRINNGKALRLADADSSHYIALVAPSTVASNVTLTFPATAGSVNNVLTTNGSGVLSWAAPGVSVTDQSADTTSYNVTLTTATTGSISGISTSSTKLTFQPSTGRLSATELRATASTASTTTSTGALVVTGGLGVGGQITAATIVETSSIALKENINPINNALEGILKLSGVTYDRIDTKEHEAGLIAEWVEQVFPDLVTRDKDGKAVGIKYTKLTAYLIESIKSLKQEINELKGIR